jgi:hypothetical protein
MELQWIADHAREYKGQWVAFYGNQSIAHVAIMSICGDPHPAILMFKRTA